MLTKGKTAMDFSAVGEKEGEEIGLDMNFILGVEYLPSKNTSFNRNNLKYNQIDAYKIHPIMELQ
jgi:hypothetical protein